jgi:hypothetical protein
VSLVFRLFLAVPYHSFFPRSWDVWFHPFLIRQQSLQIATTQPKSASAD